MPVLEIHTNTECDDMKSTIAEASRLIAEMLGKPESYVMVRIDSSSDMLFAGSSEPCARLSLTSLGLPENKTAEYSRQLCSMMERHFGVSPGRTYIEFSGPPRHMFGWNNSTF